MRQKYDPFQATLDVLHGKYDVFGFSYVKNNLENPDYDKSTITEDNSMFGLGRLQFGPVGAGMCRLTMDGHIAVKTASGYKSYDMAKNSLYNCDSFVFDVGNDMFFVIPTNSVAIGDIVLIGDKPKFVLKVDSDMLTVIDFEDGSIKQILPERHMFLGNTYLYGKIVSMFGDITKVSGTENVLKYMMMSQMFNGMRSDGVMNPMMMFLLMNKGGTGIFDGIFGNAEETTVENKTEE